MWSQSFTMLKFLTFQNKDKLESIKKERNTAANITTFF
jgi:hypothetical protein